MILSNLKLTLAVSASIISLLNLAEVSSQYVVGDDRDDQQTYYGQSPVIPIIDDDVWWKVSNVPQLELDALRDFYFATSETDWNLKWLETVHWPYMSPEYNETVEVNPCTQGWQGIVCDCDLPPDSIWAKNTNYAYVDRGYYANSEADYVNSTTCHITKIMLGMVDLRGTIPDSFANLQYLTDLTVTTYAGNTGLRGTFPNAFLSLHNLVHLNIANNDFSGTLPNSIGSIFPHLKSFIITNNNFEGTIPNSMGNLTELVGLFIKLNSFSGSFPGDIFALPSLKTVEMSYNSFTGTLADTFCSSVDAVLSDVNVNHNRFSGTIPDSLFSSVCAQSLEIIDIGFNHFTGPNKLDLLFNNSNSMLKYLSLDNNYLLGSLSVFHHLFESLTFFTCQNIHLTGSIPHSIELLSNIDTLLLTGNQLTGVLPSSMANMLKLDQFWAGDNNLHGTIPDIFHVCDFNMFVADRTSYQCMLDVYNNHFTGTIPQSLIHLNSFQWLQLNDNLLEGTIPSMFFNTSYIVNYLFLQNNLFTGSLIVSPPLYKWMLFFWGYEYLKINTLDVAGNRLTGPIPLNLFQYTGGLTDISLSKNCFSSVLSEQICNASSLNRISMNGLNTQCGGGDSSTNSRIGDVGTIPKCLYELPFLTSLQLSGNGYTGSLPSNITFSQSFVDLSLSHNELRGEIPYDFQNKSWSSLDLSYNKLSGGLKPYFKASQFQYGYLNIMNEKVYKTVNESKVSLTANRLSGNIPPTFRDAMKISVLQGNMFGCDYEASTLPLHDSAQDNYSCGTNALNILLYIWIGLCALVCIVGSIDRNFLNVSLLKQNSVVQWELLNTLQRIVLEITLVILLVLMPVYIYCSYHYKTYQYSYAWIVSGVFLSGDLAAVIMCIIWFGLLFLLYTRLEFSLFGQQFRQQLDKSTDNNSSPPIQHSFFIFEHNFCIFFIVLVNIVIVLAINIVYIYVELTYSNLVNAFAQIALACFKLGWNNYCLPRLLNFAFSTTPTTNNDKLSTSNTNNDNTVFINNTREINRIKIETMLNVFNNIIAPCIATMGVSVNCFYNLIVPPPEVDSTYTYTNCVIDNNGAINCYFSEATTTVNFSPTFSYSYQCSSTLVTSYITVFVYMFLADAFINPLVTKLSVFLIRKYYKKPALVVFYTNKPLKFDKNRFVIKLISNTAILLTFGVLFPPLAVIICYSNRQDMTDIFEEIQSYLLQNTVKTNNAQEQLDHLESKLSSVSLIVAQLLWMILFVVSAFYSFLLFDIIGDVSGWKTALKVSVIVFCCSVAFLWLVEIIRYLCITLSSYMSEDNSSDITDDECNGLELKDIPIIAPDTVLEDNNSLDNKETPQLSKPKKKTNKKRKRQQTEDAADAVEDCCQTLLSVWFR